MDRLNKFLNEKLNDYFEPEIIEEVLKRYDEPWRKFHTREHLLYIFDCIDGIAFWVKADFMLTFLFHDVVYLPWAKDNEEKSAELFEEYWIKHSKQKNVELVETVKQYILGTKHHQQGLKSFNELDCAIVERETDFKKLLRYEEHIYQEFSFVPYDVYKKNRVAFLHGYVKTNPLLRQLIDYVEYRRPIVMAFDITETMFGEMPDFYVEMIDSYKNNCDKVMFLVNWENMVLYPTKYWNVDTVADAKLYMMKHGVELTTYWGNPYEYYEIRGRNTGERFS